jgi:hypothetical protein
MVDAPGMFKILTQFVSIFGERKKIRLRSLSLLVDKKFGELDGSHKLFIRLLDELHDHITVARKRLNKTDDIRSIVEDIRSAIDEISRVRSEGRERRRSEYEQARVYADNVLSDRSILKRTPEDITVKIQAFMLAYCAYFSRERAYEHELHSALKLVDRTIVRRFGSSGKDSLIKSNNKRKIKTDMDRCLSKIRASVCTSRERWAVVASAYHLLGQSFREHGLIE